MIENFLSFSRPTLGTAEAAEVMACLASGWLATGPRVQQFEQMLQDYFDAPHVLALTSATAGLHLSLLALDLAPGDEVITTSLTFIATLNTIVQAGGTPVLVDIDPDTLNMDLEQVAAAISPRTRAILPVHFAGLPVDLARLYALAEDYNLRVIEDAAHAIGAQYNGQRIGSFGDTQVFSFHPNKNMTTGEGGCVVTRDAELAQRIQTLRFHGIDRSAWQRNTKEGSQHYDVIAPGFKYNMMDLQAALGLHQLPQVDDFNHSRYQLAQRYHDLLANWSQWELPADPAQTPGHAWHIYTPRLNVDVAGCTRDEFIQKMKEYNIGIGLHYEPVHLYTYYRERYGWQRGDFPVAEYVGDHIVSLPLFPQLTEEQQDYVVLSMKKVFSK
jgi:dTDP-4-amino-4,6-dideoxygalactose transaminase